MSKDEIAKLLQPRHLDHPAFDLFVEAMKDRRYGESALAQAWYFFREGWEMGADPLYKIVTGSQHD